MKAKMVTKLRDGYHKDNTKSNIDTIKKTLRLVN